MKWPEKGKVKTRLTAALGEDAVCELYKCFVEDLLNTVALTGIRPLIAFHPEGAEDRIRAWLGAGYSYAPQVGADLGQRMKNAVVAVARLRANPSRRHSKKNRMAFIVETNAAMA